ncbi:Tetratricopeptide-like helical [Rhypophila decipiens]
MATLAESIRATFTPSVFRKVRQLWFGHVADDTQLVLPPSNLIQQWFTSDASFDKLCRENFQAQLSFITDTQSHDSGKEKLYGNTILSALGHNPSTTITPGSLKPLDFLSLIILLDQVPRNCYRGDIAKIAFTIFDPIVQEIVKTAITNEIPQSPEIRYRVGYRLWFYLPLQHSEDRTIQDLSVREHRGIFEDLHELIRSDPGPGAKETADVPIHPALGSLSEIEVRQFLLQNPQGLEKWENMLPSFAVRHQAVIERFGRFPHRNEVLGRQPTEEEASYLREGGETFVSSREKFVSRHGEE